MGNGVFAWCAHYGPGAVVSFWWLGVVLVVGVAGVGVPVVRKVMNLVIFVRSSCC